MHSFIKTHNMYYVFTRYGSKRQRTWFVMRHMNRVGSSDATKKLRRFTSGWSTHVWKYALAYPTPWYCPYNTRNTNARQQFPDDKYCATAVQTNHILYSLGGASQLPLIFETFLILNYVMIQLYQQFIICKLKKRTLLNLKNCLRKHPHCFK